VHCNVFTAVDGFGTRGRRPLALVGSSVLHDRELGPELGAPR
jgi:hypothetical protein